VCERLIFLKTGHCIFLADKKKSFARDLFEEDFIPSKLLPHFVCGSLTLVYRI
jgi:hypothetical protein